MKLINSTVGGKGMALFDFLQKKETVFQPSGIKRSAGNLKNAFFDYILTNKKRQAKRIVLLAKIYLLNLFTLRKRSAFSCRKNCFPMILQIFPERIIQCIFP